MSQPPHRCDDRCACPVHGTPLLYWPAGDDHACGDRTCEFAHGMNDAVMNGAAALPALRRRDELAGQRNAEYEAYAYGTPGIRL